MPEEHDGKTEPLNDDTRLAHELGDVLIPPPERHLENFAPKINRSLSRDPDRATPPVGEPDLTHVPFTEEDAAALRDLIDSESDPTTGTGVVQSADATKPDAVDTIKEGFLQAVEDGTVTTLASATNDDAAAKPTRPSIGAALQLPVPAAGTDPAPLTPPAESVLDFIDADPTTPASPVPSAESALDFIDADPAPAPPASEPPATSIFGAIDRELAEDAVATPTPPDHSALDFIDADLATPAQPTPPEHSALDFIDADPAPGQSDPEQPATSIFGAIDRELVAEAASAPAAAPSGPGRGPIWLWPVVAAAVIALAAFLLLRGDGEAPDATAAGGGAISATAAATSPAAGSIPAGNPTSAPTISATAATTMAPAQIPDLVVCPDGSTFSGYEQPDGSYTDAETGEPHVCPPPPS